MLVVYWRMEWNGKESLIKLFARFFFFWKNTFLQKYPDLIFLVHNNPQWQQRGWIQGTQSSTKATSTRASGTRRSTSDQLTRKNPSERPHSHPLLLCLCTTSRISLGDVSWARWINRQITSICEIVRQIVSRALILSPAPDLCVRPVSPPLFVWHRVSWAHSFSFDHVEYEANMLKYLKGQCTEMQTNPKYTQNQSR